MTTRAKTAEEHVRIALEFLEHSDREFEAGDELQGSEKLWGAASHAVTAIAMKRNWRHGKYNARAAAVSRLAQEYDDPLLTASFSVAQKFHANFYRDFMENEEIAQDRPMVDTFVRRIVGIWSGSPVEPPRRVMAGVFPRQPPFFGPAGGPLPSSGRLD